MLIFWLFAQQAVNKNACYRLFSNNQIFSNNQNINMYAQNRHKTNRTNTERHTIDILLPLFPIQFCKMIYSIRNELKMNRKLQKGEWSVNCRFPSVTTGSRRSGVYCETPFRRHYRKWFFFSNFACIPIFDAIIWRRTKIV